MAIVTPTLAEIYARQGHLSEAIGIYEQLVAAGHDHAARLDALRERAVRSAERARHEARIERLKGLLSRVQARRRSP